MDRIDDELDSLRRRAYGPDADIWSDTAALARLRHLEAEAHRLAADEGRTGQGAPTSSQGAGLSPQDALEELFRASASSDDEPASRDAATALPTPSRAPAGELPSPPALSGRTRVAWTVSVAVALALAAGFTAWLYPYGVRDGLHHDARMQVQSEGASSEVIAQLGTTDPTHVRYFGEYKGLPIYATTDCLQAVVEPNQGAIYGGCAVDGIDPILDLYIPGAGQGDTAYTDIQFPRELTRDFPDGGLVRFQLDGDEVLVDEGRHPKQA